MDEILPELDPRRLADDLRQTWQGRVLAAAQGRMMLFVCSMLSHSYDDAFPTLIRVVQPLCWDNDKRSIKAPFFCSIGKVNKRGQIVADAILRNRDGKVYNRVIFADIRDFEYELRKLADATRLSDADRIEFFTCAKRWVGSDQRLDPTMDARDPDSRHLTVH